MAASHSVQLAPEQALQIGSWMIPNTITATALVTILLIGFAILVRLRAGVIPSRWQVLFEGLFLFFYEKLEENLGEKRARKIVPLVLTLFLIILLSNQFILFPLVGSVIGEEAVFFRTPTTHYSMTIALALIVMGTAHLLAFSIAPLGHLGNYFRLRGFWEIVTGKRSWKELHMVGIDFFLGLLEIIGDLAKVISLATRLFGNIFSGEVVITMIIGLMFATQFFVPIPFIFLAAFFGIIQAFVFALLAGLFISNTIVHASHKH